MNEEEIILKIRTDADTTGLDTIEQKAGGLSSKLSSLAGPAAAGVAAIGAAAVGVGVGLLKVGDDFGSAMDTLRTGTGAVGADLDALGDSMKSVAAGVPNSIDEVSSVMAELSSRTGLTGSSLEALTTQTLQLARVTGGDAQASVEGLTRMLGDASVPTEKQAAALDTLYKASQTTGVGVDRLSGLMVQFGAPMRNLGMSFEESTALLGRFEKEGVNTELVMGALKAASAKWAKEGLAPKEGLEQTIAAIQKMGPSAEATALAMETFDQKAGGDMVDTILGGKFAIDDLVGSIAGSSETIAKANEDTTGFAEKWEQAKNQMLVAIEPMATGVLEFAEGAGAALLDKLTPAIEAIGRAFSDLMDGDFIAVFDDLGLSMEKAKKFGEPLTALFEDISAVFSDSGGGLDGVVGVIDLLLEKFGLIGAGDFGKYFNAIKDAITGIDFAGIMAKLQPFIDAFSNGLAVVLPIVGAILTDVLWPILSTVFGFISEHIGTIAALGAAFLVLTNPIAAVVAVIMGIGVVVPWLQETFSGLGDWIANKWNEIKDWIGAAVDAISAYIAVVWQGIKDYLVAKLTEIGTNISEAWTAIKETITERIEAARVMISAKWDAIKEYLGAVLTAISKVVGDAWQAIKDNVTELVEKLKESVAEKWEELKLKVAVAIVNLAREIHERWTEIRDNLSAIVDNIRTAIVEKWEEIKLKVVVAVTNLVREAHEKWVELKDRLATAVDDMKAAILGKWGEIKAAMAQKIEEIKQTIKDKVADFAAAGSEIVAGIRKGIEDAWQNLKSWFTGLFGDLIGIAKKILGIASPSKVFAEEVGEPIGEGIIQGLRATLEANPLAGLIGGWADKSIGLAPKLITPILVTMLSTSMVAAMEKALSFGPTGGSSGLDSMWGGGVSQANPSERFWSRHYGPTKGPGGEGPGTVEASATRGGKGGHLAASKSNYWQIFVQKWGIPTESSARKTAQQLGIPLPQWLEDIYNPAGSSSHVDPVDPMKGEPAAAAEETIKSLAALTAAASEAAEAVKKMPVMIEEWLLNPKQDSGIRSKLALPGPGPGGPITIEPPPGGSVKVDTVELGNIQMGETRVYLDSREIARGIAKTFVEDVTILDQLGKALGKRKAATT